MKKLLLFISVAITLTSTSTPTKSLIGVRETIEESIEREYTASDYVQDGLIFILDGIENVGIGSHDSESSVWVDLISGEEFDIGNRYFSDISLMFPSSTKLTIYPTAILGEAFWYCNKTVELIGQVDPTAYDSTKIYGQKLIGFLQAGYGPSTNRYYRSNMECYSVENWGVITTYEEDGIIPLVEHRTAIAIESGDVRFHYDGVLKKHRAVTIPEYATGFSGFRWTGSAGCNIYCVRIYNRALTADEIKHNNAVDKARFNLP